MENVIYILKQCWEIWNRNCKLLAFLKKIWPHLGRCACEKCFAENGTINILHGTHTPRHITTAPVLIESFQFRASKETKSSLTRKFVIWFSISTILHRKISRLRTVFSRALQQCLFGYIPRQSSPMVVAHFTSCASFTFVVLFFNVHVLLQEECYK